MGLGIRVTPPAPEQGGRAPGKAACFDLIRGAPASVRTPAPPSPACTHLGPRGRGWWELAAADDRLAAAVGAMRA
ncbi:MAG: hypothetical protein IT437_13875 [Phycisphaerales bacterium]|nr:hypothetical protein [Phycisphaerales bacterium]